MEHGTFAAEDFQTGWQQLFDEISADNATVTVTREGVPVARLTPLVPPRISKPFLGYLEGSVLRYDEPFEPAEDPQAWDAVRDPD